MDKNTILEKSRQENRYQDERDKQIELEACRGGLNVVFFVTCALFLALGFKSKAQGTTFDSWYLILLPMWSSMIGSSFVKWRRHRCFGDLISTISGVVMVLIAFWMCLMGPIR